MMEDVLKGKFYIQLANDVNNVNATLKNQCQF